MLAYDYPILGLFWTMLMFFIWVAWIMLLFRVFGDIFRSDMSGGMKAVWSIFVLVVPFIGVFVYLLVRGPAMAEREMAEAAAAEGAFRDYVRETAGGSGGVADELSKLADLHSRGLLTDDEFAAQKSKLLA